MNRKAPPPPTLVAGVGAAARQPMTEEPQPEKKRKSRWDNSDAPAPVPTEEGGKRKSRWDDTTTPAAPPPGGLPAATLEAVKAQVKARAEAMSKNAQWAAQPSSSLGPGAPIAGHLPGVMSTQVGGAMVTSSSGARVFYPPVPALPAALPATGMVTAPGGIGRVFIPPADQQISRRRSPSPPPVEEPAPAPRKRRGFRETVEEPAPKAMPQPPRPKDRFSEEGAAPLASQMPPPSMPPPSMLPQRPPRGSD